MFTRRLKKAKLKDLDKQLLSATGNEAAKLRSELDYVKKEVFTCEKKAEQRRKGFEKAKNIQKQTLSEFM